jgi:hypothetical protein
MEIFIVLAVMFVFVFIAGGVAGVALYKFWTDN